MQKTYLAPKLLHFRCPGLNFVGGAAPGLRTFTERGSVAGEGGKADTSSREEDNGDCP